MLIPRISRRPDGLEVVVPSGPPFVCGATLLAVLSDPPTSPSDRATLDSWRAWTRIGVDHEEQLDPTWMARPQPVAPIVLTLSVMDAIARLPRMRERHEARMAAAAAYAPFVQAAEERERTGRLPKRRLPQLQQRALQLIEQEQDRSDAFARLGHKVTQRFSASVDNFETRVLRASRPVLPLALAMAQAIRLSIEALASSAHEPGDGQDIDLEHGKLRRQVGAPHILLQPAIQRWIVARACALEPYVRAMPGLRAKPELVSVRLQASGAYRSGSV